MKGSIFVFVIDLLVLTVVAVRRPRGVSLEKASFYQEDRDFTCLSDGKVIPFSYVNDDYCDCSDGSDEPGTSACPSGLFYCENKGHKGMYIKSSRVNDGFCDCCDGSDEFDGIIDCPNTCMEHYKIEMERQEALRRNQEEGFKVKQEYMQQGKRAKDEKRSRLSELEKEKELLTSEKDSAEAMKDAAEEPEKAAKEEHTKAWEKVKEEKQKAKDRETAAKAFAILDVNKDGSVDYPELSKHKEFDIDSDGTVSDEEAKEYLEDNEQVDLTTFAEKIWPNIKEIFKLEEQETTKPAEDASENKEETEFFVPDEVKKETGDNPAVAEKDVPSDIPVDVVEGGSLEDEWLKKSENVDDFEGYSDEGEDEEDDDEEGDDDDDEDSAYTISNKAESAEPEEDKEPEYSEETKQLIAAADEARNKFDEAERRLRENEREINDIKEYLEIDFGPEEEFAALKDQCFEYTDREYTYRLCPFSKATQKNKNGGIETSLGTWGKWHGPADAKYDAMKYENGQGCWDGPSRSTHVNLHCGSTNEVTSALEPSRCEYHFEFTTPAKCDAPKPVEMRDVHEEL